MHTVDRRHGTIVSFSNDYFGFFAWPTITRMDDGGLTWDVDYILRDDGHDMDLGYPASVELANGDILTVYYQKPFSSLDQCGLAWTRWRVPNS